MTLKLTILGCGTSSGVPRIGPDWGACDPSNPKNSRLRCSALVEKRGENGTTRVLIDTSPDCRQQLLSVGIHWLDGVLYTHDHADHTHGIDELRNVGFSRRQRVDVYYNERTGALLRKRFDYCFGTLEGSDYPAILNGHEIEPGKPVRIAGEGGEIEALPFLQQHGRIESIGYRFGPIAYSCDIKGLSEESFAALADLDVWIVDALKYTTHPSHFCVDEALEAIARVKPKRAILTHMHPDLDYETLAGELPDGIEPAYDGLTIEL